MEKKTSGSRYAPLQRVTAEDVTDPVEQAEMDEQRRRYFNEPRKQGPGAGADIESVSPVVELCRQLPERERTALLLRVVAGLAPEIQLELLQQAAMRLSAEDRQQIEDDLRRRLAKCSA